MYYILAFVLGLFTGATLGVLTLALLRAAGRQEDCCACDQRLADYLAAHGVRLPLSPLCGPIA